MAVLDDIRNGKGLKPIYAGYECATCKNKNCTGHGLPTTEKVCDGYKHTTTNADRIRAMTDEELARFLWQSAPYDNCPPIKCIEFETGKKPTTDECIACWGRWLKQEVTE